MRELIAWENSRHFVTPQLVSPWNDVWETSAEIPYWWRITTQIWVVLLRVAWESWFTQSEAPPRSGYCRVISMEFLCSFLRRHFAGKPVVPSRTVGCFLRLVIYTVIKQRKKRRLKAIKYYSVLKKIFNGALIPITPASSHLSSLHFFKQNILVNKLANGRII